MAEQQNLKSESESTAIAEPGSAPRKRKISGFESCGEGIKVHGDDAYDPYRFQDFEVTPEFRQQVLEAPLPLLDLRYLNNEVPANAARPRASANDVTQPELLTRLDSKVAPEFATMGEETPLPGARPASNQAAIPGTELAQITTKFQVRRKSSPIPRWLLDGASYPKRKLIFAGALAVVFLGMALAHLNAGPPAASPQKTVDPAVDVPLLPIESTRQVTRAVEKPGLQVTSAAPAAPYEESTTTSLHKGPSQGRPAVSPHSSTNQSPQASGTRVHSSKTLWLPIE